MKCMFKTPSNAIHLQKIELIQSVLTMGFCFMSLATAASWSLSNVLMTGTKASLAFTESVAIGIQRGMEECGVQFAWERWNCPRHVFVRTKTLPANRESAFVHAVTSAGVMHTLTRNCSMGNFENCGCDDTRLRVNGGRKWKWGGCSENIPFGEDISRDFLESRHLSKDPRALVVRHNNEAGRVAVKKSMRRLCKCHGVSGSCSTQTCWMQLSEFRAVGNLLKQQYDNAIRVDYQNGILSVGEVMRPTLPELSESTLVYLEKSPDYCTINITAGSHGTLGRECSRDKGPLVNKEERHSCKILCRQCGLRVKKTIAEVMTSCNCKFHWCCDVKCEQCRRKINKLTCIK